MLAKLLATATMATSVLAEVAAHSSTLRSASCSIVSGVCHTADRLKRPAAAATRPATAADATSVGRSSLGPVTPTVGKTC